MENATNATMVQTASSTIDPTQSNYVSPNSNANLRNFIYSIITVNAVSAAVSVAFNMLIIAAFVKNSSLRTPSFVLILSLAVSDLCVGGVVQVRTNFEFSQIFFKKLLATHAHGKIEEVLNLLKIMQLQIYFI